MRKNVSAFLTVLCLLSAMFLIGCKVAKATPITIHVPADYPTIQAAINNARDGDTVQVSSGTYYENVVVNKTISLIGEDESNTIIDGGNASDTILVVADNVTVSGFTAINGVGGWPHGGIVLGARNSVINGNNVSYNYGSGIITSFIGHNNSILKNVVTHNSLEGIRVDGLDSGAKVEDNTVENNEIRGAFLYSVSNCLFENNVISSNENDGIWTGANSSDCLFENNVISSNEYNGFAVDNSSDCLFENNVISSNGHNGFVIGRSSNVLLENNVISSTGLRGIEANNYCFNIKAKRNLIVDSGWEGLVFQDSDSCVAEGNVICGSGLSTPGRAIGIDLIRTNSDTITLNSLIFDGIGIYVTSTSVGSTIYGNNFYNNVIHQAYVEPQLTAMNAWDKGYPTGGNYWSDYNGTDLYSGVYQNETGHDWIGDTPYVIDANNKDNYPLMNSSSSSVISDYASLLASFNSLNATYNNLQSAFNQLNATYNNLLSSFKQLSASYVSLQSSYSGLNATVESMNSNLKTQMLNLQSRLDSVNSTLQSQITSDQSNHNSLTNQLNTVLNVAYALVAVMVILVLLVVYLVIRRPRTKPEK